MTEDNFLAEVTKEGDEPIFGTEKDTPAESPTEIKPEKSEKKEVAFHEHPRWIERENKLKEFETRNQEIERELAELKKPKSDVEIDPEWKALWGDNPDAYQKWLALEAKREEKVKKDILEEQQKQVEQQKAETDHWNKWVSDELGKLEAEGNKFDRNALIKTMLDFRPTDEHNNFDFKKGYEIYKALNPENTVKADARKQVADMVTKGGSKTDGDKKHFRTSDEMRRRSWGSLGNLDD